MARRLKNPQLSLGALDSGKVKTTSRPPTKRRSHRPNPEAVNRATLKAEEMVESFRGNPKAFDSAGAPEFVGLYAMLHEAVYGVAPDELANDWTPAVKAARKMFEEEFDEDVRAFVAFIRWTWVREKKREKWRRENGRDANRIGWRLQFQSRAMLTDYKVALARRNGRVR